MPRDRFLILTYHRVLAEADPIRPAHITAAVFDSQLRALDTMFRVLDLQTAIRLCRESRLPRGTVVVTFDDGYRDNVDVALPILQRQGFPATFFIATGFLNGEMMWNDVVVESLRKTDLRRLVLDDINLGSYDLESLGARCAAIEFLIPALKYLDFKERQHAVMQIRDRCGTTDLPELMMSDNDVLSLRRGGMEVGAHTMGHPILSRLDDDDAREEIDGSRRYLERLLSERVAGFAYPNGRRGQDYDKQHVSAVRAAGFDFAVSTDPGCASATGDVYQLPRFGLWERSVPRVCWTLARRFLRAPKL